MKRTTKYVVLAAFAIIVIISVILLGTVKINYNISDYLDDSTETKISLNIMEDEFATVGNIQVMVEDITVDEANRVSAIIREVQGVLLVNFNPEDEGYFKARDNGKGDALFAVIVEGDEYSETAAATLESIKASLDSHFEGKTNYGGAVVEKINMRNTMKSEIYIILAIAIVFALAIMLIMATSWFEPGILILSSLIAVLINLGTNAIFGQISYITAAVAAILQLALSVDYSIVLLHNFRALKKEYEDKQAAMLQAIKVTWKPVLASAATTALGLLALVFMTMEIGKDIGFVLTKGIAISMITSLTLLPALLLVCDNFMQRFSKRDLVLSGKKLCTVAMKAGKPILIVAVALIVLCCSLNLQNTYSFTDTANPNKKIIKTFGSNNTIVVVYPKSDNGIENESKLADKLMEYKTEKGETPFQSYTAYSNTLGEVYTIEMAAKKLNIPQDKVEDLFKMYHNHNNDSNNRKLSPLEFVEYSINLIKSNPEEVGNFVDESTLATLEMMRAIYDITNGSHTADELYTLVSTGAMSGTGLSAFQIKHMYNLYQWDDLEDKEVPFEEMLKYMVDLTQDENGRTFMSEKTASDLTELYNGIQDFKSQMNMEVTQEEFRAFGHEKFGDGWFVDIACDALFMASKKGDTARIVDVLKKVELVSGIIPEDYRAYIENYSMVYDALDEDHSYSEFFDRLPKVVLALTNEERPIDATEAAVQQGYVMYFDKQGAFDNIEIDGMEFIGFVNSMVETNTAVSANLSESSRLKLLDVVYVDEFISDSTQYNCDDMTKKLNALQSNIKSIASSSSISGGAISGIYFKYVDENMDLPTDPIVASDILEYVTNNMNNPESALYSAITPEYKEKVEERQQAMDNAKELFLGTADYNRMLISVNLPSESEESSKFVQYLIAAIREVYGEDAHPAGHIVSTYELQESFETDNKIISIFTVVSIFLIIMIIFKSISLPVLLVAVIQGAIWISMSMSLLTGSMFFMSYIIATCILMGSTIDYGILMSTTYVKYRSTMNKKEALEKAVAAAMPTIFTSGLILIICGFIVGALASMTSISTVGMLLGRGTLVSVAMITLVLPAILYVLDGFIYKLTIKDKKSNE